MLQAIRSWKGSADTLVERVGNDTKQAVDRQATQSAAHDRRAKERELYQQRKEAGLCTRCGDPASDDSLCSTCGPALREQIAASTRKLRRLRRRRDQCARCGKPSPDRYECLVCLTKLGRLPKSAHTNPTVDQRKGQWVERMEQSPDGVPRIRRRFVGQTKRGRRSIADLDRDDLGEARRELEIGMDGLAAAAAPSTQQLPRVQRDDVRNEALSKLVAAGRWITEVLKRHGYEIPTVIADDEDSDE